MWPRGRRKDCLHAAGAAAVLHESAHMPPWFVLRPAMYLYSVFRNLPGSIAQPNTHGRRCEVLPTPLTISYDIAGSRFVIFVTIGYTYSCDMLASLLAILSDRSTDGLVRSTSFDTCIVPPWAGLSSAYLVAVRDILDHNVPHCWLFKRELHPENA